MAEIRLASCTRGEALIFVLLTKPFFWVTYVKLLLIFTGASENRNYLIDLIGLLNKMISS